ncbi:MAG: hypothetical protein DME93_04770 [Verrucomicrobia bacterium]|nr:MAG: hypothetical protein DME93_04770 [Verrucomicrobiota bacterium]
MTVLVRTPAMTFRRSQIPVKGNESQPSDHDEPGQHRDQTGDFLIWNRSIKSNPESEVVGERDQ